MKLLAELQSEAKEDQTKRKVFLIFPSGAKQTGEFLDPFFGLLKFDAEPNHLFNIKDLTPFLTKGMFLLN